MNMNKIALCLLLVSCINYGMENVLSCQTTMPSKEITYVDYILVQNYFGKERKIQEIPFGYLQEEKEQVIDRLNRDMSDNADKDNLKKHHGITIKEFVSLLRIYNDFQTSEGLKAAYRQKKITTEALEKALLKLGAEKGTWTIAEAITKIKQHGSAKL